MRLALDPRRPVGPEVRRVAAGRLDDALERLAGTRGASAEAVEDALHAARKRCKEVRGLARLARHDLHGQYRTFNELVRDGARELSELRDAHALLVAVDALAEIVPAEQLAAVRKGQADLAARTATAVAAGDPRIDRAVQYLAEARHEVDEWKVGDTFGALAPGLARTYRDSRRAWHAALVQPDDGQIHTWRRHAKYLWYQLRLVESAAPELLGPLVGELDALGETLGHDHDLAVLIARMRAEPRRFGGVRKVEPAVTLARAQQDDLRQRAFHSAATIWAERPRPFVKRVRKAWETAAVTGRGGRTSGRRDVAIERERKFLVAELPDLSQLDTPAHLRQGYLVATERAATRVRASTDPAGHAEYTLTVKSGPASASLELEVPISAEQFAVAWPNTSGYRVDKHRYRIPYGDHTIELDMFHDALDGLVVAEVEFADEASLQQFVAPPWFGREVTDDSRYKNSALAADGAPPG